MPPRAKRTEGLEKEKMNKRGKDRENIKRGSLKESELKFSQREIKCLSVTEED